MLGPPPALTALKSPQDARQCGENVFIMAVQGATDIMKNQPSLFTQLDVSPSSQTAPLPTAAAASLETNQLLRQLLTAQDRQNELLEEMISQVQASQRQRAGELGQWKQANPHLARRCRFAAESLSKVQTAFLENLTEEIEDNADGMLDGEFVLNEFVDRFGPRMAHLNGVLQLLTQLSSTPEKSGAS
jgi:hypothetical protein